MNKELANIVFTSAARARWELGELMPLIKTHCTKEEYEVLSQAIGSIVFDISELLISKLVEFRPEISVEAEYRQEMFGRTFY